MKSWIYPQRKEGHPVSQMVIKREAKAHAIWMNIHDFKGSCCWVANFMNHPSNVIVSSNEKSCMTATETLLWYEAVWMKRKSVMFNV